MTFHLKYILYTDVSMRFMSIKATYFALSIIIGLAFFSPTSQAGETTNSLTPQHHYSFEQSVESLGEEVVHPKDPYQLIPGKNPDGWGGVIEPYGWLPALSGDVGVKGLPPVHINPTSKDLLKHLDWGAFLKGEVRRGRWGIIGDGFFVQLSTSAETPGPLYNPASIRFQQGMASLAAAYRVIDDRRWFLDFYAGARLNYMGVNLNTSVDTSAIENVGREAAQQITQQAVGHAESAIASDVAATQQAITSSVQQQLSQSTLVHIVQSVPTIESDVQQLTPIEKKSIEKSLHQAQPQIQALAAAAAQQSLAAAQVQVAQAKNQLTAALQNSLAQAQANLTQAQNKLSQVLSQNIKSELPTSGTGTQIWVDPIIGLRTQINLTRVLFLAAQADVGGFGAGSQIAWNVTATAGVNITRQVYGEVGYRYFYMDYSNNSGALYNAAEYGIFAGIGIKL